MHGPCAESERKQSILPTLQGVVETTARGAVETARKELSRIRHRLREYDTAFREYDTRRSRRHTLSRLRTPYRDDAQKTIEIRHKGCETPIESTTGTVQMPRIRCHTLPLHVGPISSPPQSGPYVSLWPIILSGPSSPAHGYLLAHHLNPITPIPSPHAGMPSDRQSTVYDSLIYFRRPAWKPHHD